MREITFKEISDAVKEMCIKTNKNIGQDVLSAVSKAYESENSELGKSILSDLIKNYDAAKRLDIPICQDTGMTVVFVELGQEVCITGGLLSDAINDGVRRGYVEGYLRCSVVSDPINRVNTGDNTPAIVHTSIVKGDRLKITVAPKGFGSENMSAIRMLLPLASRQEIIDFIVETAKNAGGNACPPMVLGVGIGGNFEYCALLAKKALCRPIGVPNANETYAKLERDALKAVNALGIGPMGFGGDCTALAVNIEAYPTHIAGLPVAVNVGCHVNRHGSVVL